MLRGATNSKPRLDWCVERPLLGTMMAGSNDRYGSKPPVQLTWKRSAALRHTD